MNERKTEILIRDLLNKAGYYTNENLIMEEQQSDSPRIRQLLKNASKRGKGIGYPEFIIRSRIDSDFIIIIECKADPQNHASVGFDNPEKFAVDGAMLYASFLARDYNVLAIGVSGETQKTLKISHYLCTQNSSKFYPAFGNEILSFENYRESFMRSDVKLRQDFNRLLDYTRDLNETLHKVRVKEADRSLLISGILIALQNPAFESGYKKHRSIRQLASQLTATIVDEFTDAGLPSEKITHLKQAFSILITLETLLPDKQFFENLITEIDRNINRFIRTHKYYDAVGQFYIEFLRYANNDKGLGIVLTPPHITELFVELAEINKDSVVYDNCCGTGGFLISAMKKMMEDAHENKKKIDSIQRHQLVGVEDQNNIYALAVSNMIIHGDGKTNIVHDNCFKIAQEIKRRFEPTTGLLNPPYKSKKGDIEEAEFILNNLEALSRGSKCVAIIPISCVLQDSGDSYELKKRLMLNHTLEAVMSMPPDLFHNSKVGVVTCAIVMTAHMPHPRNKETWLGYWRNDGFVKLKHKGRVDANNTWNKIRDEWVTAYKNRTVLDGMSVMKCLAPEDEWCAEAYMVTDYSGLSQEDFERELKKYVAFQILNETQETI